MGYRIPIIRASAFAFLLNVTIHHIVVIMECILFQVIFENEDLNEVLFLKENCEPKIRTTYD